MKIYHINGNNTDIISTYDSSGKPEARVTVERGEEGLKEEIERSGTQESQSGFVLASDLDQTILTNHSDTFISSGARAFNPPETQVEQFLAQPEPVLRNEEELIDTFAQTIATGGKLAITTSNKHPEAVALLLNTQLLPKLTERLGHDPSDQITVIMGRERTVQRGSSKDEHFDLLHNIYGKNAKIAVLDDDIKNIDTAAEHGIHGLCCTPGNSKTMSGCLSEIRQYAEGAKDLPQISPSLIAEKKAIKAQIAAVQQKPTPIIKFDLAAKIAEKKKRQGGGRNKIDYSAVTECAFEHFTIVFDALHKLDKPYTKVMVLSSNIMLPIVYSKNPRYSTNILNFKPRRNSLTKIDITSHNLSQED